MPENKVSLDDMKAILGIGGPATGGNVVGKLKIDEDGNYEVVEGTLKQFGEDVRAEAVKKLQPALVDTIAKATAAESEAVEKKLRIEQRKTHAELIKLANSVRKIEVVTPKGSKKLEGIQHNQFENLLKVISTGQAAFLVGPAGTGKSHAAETVADSLDLDFHAISVGSQTSKSDLLGYMTATGDYIRTQFREAYEHGGIFLLDEADAGNSNVLILLNSGLSNGQMAFPDGMVKAHEDFRMIATANTYGYGASRQYVGRNQLDAATLDRFVVLDWDIDEKLEASFAAGVKDGDRWLRVVRAVRNHVLKELDIRMVVSPRAVQRGVKLLSAGLDFETILPMALTSNTPNGHRKDLENVARAAWSK